MITRSSFARTWGVHSDGIMVAPEVIPDTQPVIRTGRVGLTLPPRHVAMDITDPKTWRRPVRFT